jgi:uncharacterized membrane protein YbhN (UPF0104 family)
MAAEGVPALRSSLASCTDETLAKRHRESEISMKRAMDALWPVIGLGAVILSGWLLLRELKGLRFADVADDLLKISPLHWLLAIGCSALAYAALAWYDQIALMHLGRKLPWRFVGLVSFTTYALAHNIGASVFSGAIVRYRAYSTRGLSAAEVGLLVAFCSITFTLGNLLLAGVVLMIEPLFVRRIFDASWLDGRAVALALLALPWLYTLGALLHFRPVKVLGFELVYPRPPIALRQLLAGPIELIGAAGIIYFALPANGNPGFLIVLAAFLASFSLALVSHAPGGLGVLELTFIKILPDAPRAELVAALLVFRLLYLILPLIFSLVVVVLFERERIAALVNGRKRVSP